MGSPHARDRAESASGPPAVFRWECHCQQPPVLLATYDARGRVNIKVRDRYWIVRGAVRTFCPRCGAEHTLDLTTAPRAASEQNGG